MATLRPTGLQVEEWRLLWEEVLHDPERLAECRNWDERRRYVRPQMLDLLHRYLARAIDTEELRAMFDRRARTDWNAFGLSGMSGVVFLNRLVHRIPDRDALAAHLRAVLPVPHNADEARSRLRAFIAFLDRLTRAGTVSAARLQPGRSTFFISAWWHLQDPEHWPSFQPSARYALRCEQSLYTPAGDPVEDYLAFRDADLALARALEITSSELEYLCWWHHRRDEHDEGDDPTLATAPAFQRPPSLYRKPLPHARVVRESERKPDGPLRPRRVMIAHTHVQWLLAKMGRRLGCRVWIAANDQAKTWTGESLGALSVRHLPSLGLHPDSQRIVSLIDVVWLKGANQVAAAFEIEHTSSIYSGLLRMADLATLSPNLTFPLYIVTPRERIEKVRRELTRPTLQMLGLHRRCAFFSSEALLDAAEGIMQWAGEPGAVERLAMRVESIAPDPA